MVSLAGVSAAMYEDRALVRMMAMRRTLFVVPSDLVATVHAAASLAVAARLRAGLLKDLDTIPTDPKLPRDLAGWLGDVEDKTEAALLARGTATANDLATDEPRLRTALLPTTDKSYDVRRNITTHRVLTLMVLPRAGWSATGHAGPGRRGTIRGLRRAVVARGTARAAGVEEAQVAGWHVVGSRPSARAGPEQKWWGPAGRWA